MGEFETALKNYVSGMEDFVRSVHAGLTDLSASLEAAAEDDVPVSKPAGASADKPRRTFRLQSPKKVLVVEETEIHRVLFGRYFQAYPIEIKFARNAGEAEELQAQAAFDLVITDWKTQLQAGLAKGELIEKVLSQLEA